jgi:hypothetical protein
MSLKHKIQDKLLNDGQFVTDESKAKGMSNAELRRRGLTANAIGLTILAGGAAALVETIDYMKDSVDQVSNSKVVIEDTTESSAQTYGAESTATLTELPPVTYEDDQTNFVVGPE